MRIPRGLRTRLVVRAALLAAAAMALVGIVIDLSVVRPLGARLDRELESRVRGLAAVVAEGGPSGFFRQAPRWLRSERAEFCALRSGSGALLGSAGRPLPPGAEEVPAESMRTIEDPVARGFRVLAIPAPGPDGERFVLVAGVSGQEVWQEQWEIRFLVVAAGIGGVLLVATGAWFGAGLVLGPLRTMTEGARRIDAERPGSGLALHGTGDEFDDLGNLLNDLLARVGGALEEERRFAGEAAHELRSPMAILRLRAEEALAGKDPEGTRRALEGALADVDRVDRLVQALLELSRSGIAVPAPEGGVDCGAVLAAMAEDLGTLGGARGVRFAYGPPASPLRTSAPREVLETATSILVDNAFRYTPAGGSVVLDAVAEDGRIRVRVRDSGPGVAREEAGRIFERLYRGKAGTASGAGFGLGLALARRLARSAGGDVTLDNPGSPGAAFVLALPEARGEAPRGAGGGGAASL